MNKIILSCILLFSYAAMGADPQTQQSQRRETAATVTREFCSGGWRNIANFTSYLARFDATRAFHTDSNRKLLVEGSQNNIRLPDEAAWKIARWTGLRDDNQYAWAVEISCLDWHQDFR